MAVRLQRLHPMKEASVTLQQVATPFFILLTCSYTPRSGYRTPEALLHELDLAKELLQRQDPTTKLPIGIGYFGWELDKDPSKATQMLQSALNSNVQSIWLSFGNDLRPYVEFIRKADATRSRKTLIAIQVSSSAEALTAVNDLKVDIVIVQGTLFSRGTNLRPQPLTGNESGGHGSSKSPAIRTLLAEVLEVLPPGHPPILAAGGLGSGRDLAEIITTHGADGAVMGTRFLATTESLYSEAKKARICGAKAEDTVRSIAFDLARGTTNWPKDIDGRGLRNKSVEDYDTGVDTQRLRAAYDQALLTTDFNRLEVWAGTGVGHVTRISPARVSFRLWL